MIKAICDTYPQGVSVDGLCNRGAWWGRTWLLGFAHGYSSFFVVAEADNPTEALDAYADSRHARFSRVTLAEADEHEKDPCLPDPHRIGNFSEPHIFDLVVAEPCRVDYFAKREDS